MTKKSVKLVILAGAAAFLMTFAMSCKSSKEAAEPAATETTTVTREPVYDPK